MTAARAGRGTHGLLSQRGEDDGDDPATFAFRHVDEAPPCRSAQAGGPDAWSGLIWIDFVLGMWIAFFAALAGDQLHAVQVWARDLPLLAELGLWLLAFPWLLGTARLGVSMGAAARTSRRGVRDRLDADLPPRSRS